MADSVNVVLYYNKVGEILNWPSVAAMCNGAAQGMADDIGPLAEVTPYSTDRAAASVSAPTWMQARDGALTRAAARAGLEVRSK